MAPSFIMLMLQGGCVCGGGDWMVWRGVVCCSNGQSLDTLHATYAMCAYGMHLRKETHCAKRHVCVCLRVCRLGLGTI
jgi:hypothetical protein